MKAYIKERTLIVARHIATTQETIRQAAKEFHLSKSTVHNDLSKRLPKVDESLFECVQKILEHNFEEKHLRGGEATKRRYEDLEKKSSARKEERKRQL